MGRRFQNKVGKKIEDKKEKQKLELPSPFYYIKYEALRSPYIETSDL